MTDVVGVSVSNAYLEEFLDDMHEIGIKYTALITRAVKAYIPQMKTKLETLERYQKVKHVQGKYINES